MDTKMRDAVYGLAVGDALGVPYEFQARDTFHATEPIGGGFHGQLAGTFSDDTSMTLATCESLRAKQGAIDAGDMRARFRAWLERGAYAIDSAVFDVGITTRRALEAGHGLDGEHDCGNGSLMRILPLAFTEANDSEIAQASAITHAHPVACRACAIHVHVARDLAAGATVSEAIARIADTEAPFDRLPEIASLEREQIRSGGYVVETLEAALWCLATTESYRACVLAAVNLGDDTDTVAAVAGGLAGIVYGMEAIPHAWLDTLRGRDLIERAIGC